MKTTPIKYSEVQVGDKIFTNGKDNHMFRKLKFLETETVSSAEKYLSKGNGVLYKIMFESGQGTLGFPDRVLEKIVES